MSVTVSDVLQLDILNSAKVIAGKNGLDREVCGSTLQIVRSIPLWMQT